MNSDLAASPFSVMVVVGTDHHPFDRLIGWIDSWLDGRRQATDGAATATATVQYGSSTPPKRAGGSPLIPHQELQQLMGAASAVVTHGGPATIVEVRRSGRRPIVVPRNPALGEHVDGHQQRFSRRLAEQGLVVLCETEQSFMAALDAAYANPASLVLSAGSSAAAEAAVAAAVDRVGAILDEQVAAGRMRRTSRRRVVGGRPPASGVRVS